MPPPTPDAPVRPAPPPRLTSRTLGITIATALAIAVCLVLGGWQWERGNVVVSEPPAGKPVVAIGDVVDAGAAAGTPEAILSSDEVGRRVTLSGTFDPALDLLVVGRRDDGRDGAWALGMVRLADGSGIPVVRGWVPAGDPAPPLPVGPVEVAGVVQPPEGADRAPSQDALPPGQVWIVSAAQLVNQVDYPVANTYVTATGVDGLAPEADGLRTVPPADPGSATRRLDLRNLAYAAQWWVFALFAGVVGWRAVRDDRALVRARAEAREDAPERSEGPPPGGDPGTDDVQEELTKR
ncbi:SURF1 family protein [Kineococcus gynurae]|uniref:SURF1-like protein n=1 Tax=Kineococcus gynurae TaxID=452979 RepID=A0ABV5LTA4_9ACTN